MAKKKVVLKVTTNDPKRRQKALQIAAGFPGVTSTSVEDDRIVLVGDVFDPVTLTNVLRKRVSCCVELISVGEDKKKEKEKEKEKKEECHNYIVVPPPYPCFAPDYCRDNSCTVM